MKTSELKKKGTAAVFWNLSGTLMKQGITFVISIFLARLLSPSDFGLVGMATVFIGLTQSFTDFGLTSGLIQKKEPTEVQYNTVFYINLGLSIVLMVLMIAFSGLIADYYKNPEIGKIARFVSYSFVINAVNGVQNAQLTKALANKIKTIASLSSSIVSGIVGISFALMGFGAWSLVYSALAGSLVSTAVIWHNSKWRPKKLFNLSEVKPLLDFGLKTFVAGFLENIYSKIDVIIIGKIFTPATLGFYYRAISFNQLITKYTSASLSGVFFPVISHLQNDRNAQLRVIKQSMHVISFLAFMIMGLMYVDARELIVILFSAKWLVSVDYFKILVFSGYVYPVSVILVNILSGNGQSGKFLKLEIWKKVTGLLAMGVGFYIGMKGFLWSTAVAGTIALLLNMWYVRKVIQWPILQQCIIVYQYALMAIAGVMPVLLLQRWIPENDWFRLIFNTLLFVSLYIAANYIMKTEGKRFAFNLLKTDILPKLTKKIPFLKRKK